MRGHPCKCRLGSGCNTVLRTCPARRNLSHKEEGSKLLGGKFGASRILEVFNFPCNSLVESRPVASLHSDWASGGLAAWHCRLGQGSALQAQERGLFLCLPTLKVLPNGMPKLSVSCLRLDSTRLDPSKIGSMYSFHQISRAYA